MVRSTGALVAVALVAATSGSGCGDGAVSNARAQPEGGVGDASGSHDASLADLAGQGDDARALSDAASALDGGVVWSPAPGASWQWQLSGALDTSFDVAAYDLDLFETTPAQIAALHRQGRRVICYLDTAYEPGRPDSAALAPYRGNAVQGWPGQYWLDVRQPQVVQAMKDRLALAAQKGCDAVEADDVDSRSNDPGFPITANDQQGFIRALAAEAHARSMGYALKNDLDEVGALLPFVDFAVNEECFAYDECDLLSPFVRAGKAVLQVEYTDGDLAAKGATVCPGANARGFDTLIKHLDLGPPRHACR